MPYKRVDLAVEAFTKLNKPLKVVGTGRQISELKEKAGNTIEFLGYVSDKDLPGLIARAGMYLMPGEEDFGIAPVEANACGVPVVAFHAGGALDVQIEGQTGCFFREPHVDSLCEAVQRAYATDWDVNVIRANALRFDTDTFIEKIKLVVATTEPGDRRGKKPIDRRRDSGNSPQANDRRRLVLKQGKPLWFDRRRHILAEDGVTVIGEQVNSDDDGERVVKLGEPFRPSTTIVSTQAVYDDGPKNVIRVVKAQKETTKASNLGDSPQTITSPLQQSVHGAYSIDNNGVAANGHLEDGHNGSDATSLEN